MNSHYEGTGEIRIRNTDSAKRMVAVFVDDCGAQDASFELNPHEAIIGGDTISGILRWGGYMADVAAAELDDGLEQLQADAGTEVWVFDTIIGDKHERIYFGDKDQVVIAKSANVLKDFEEMLPMLVHSDVMRANAMIWMRLAELQDAIDYEEDDSESE